MRLNVTAGLLQFCPFGATVVVWCHLFICVTILLDCDSVAFFVTWPDFFSFPFFEVLGSTVDLIVFLSHDVPTACSLERTVVLCRRDGSWSLRWYFWSPPTLSPIPVAFLLITKPVLMKGFFWGVCGGFFNEKRCFLIDVFRVKSVHFKNNTILLPKSLFLSWNLLKTFLKGLKPKYHVKLFIPAFPSL